MKFRTMSPSTQSTSLDLSRSANGAQPSKPTREVKHSKERKRLFDSISTDGFPAPKPNANGDSSGKTSMKPPTSNSADRQEPVFEEEPRDPRDSSEIARPSKVHRTASPFTQNPTVDFDGLSWPSECREVVV